MPPSATDQQQYNGYMMADLQEVLLRSEKRVVDALAEATQTEVIAMRTPGTDEWKLVGEKRAEWMLTRRPWDILNRAKYHQSLIVRQERRDSVLSAGENWVRLCIHRDVYTTLALAQNQLEG